MPPTRSPRASARALAILAATTLSLVAASSFSPVALAAKPGASTAPNTTITASPPNPSSSTSASFSFTSTKGGSSFACQLDNGTAGACTSPKTYTGLPAGSHTFSVFATWKGTSDPTPATYTWTIDTTPPSTPTNLTASATTATAVNLSWTASTDDLAIGGYDVYRGGTKIASTTGTGTSYTDSTVTSGATYSYTVQARDTAGNVSGQSSTATVTVPVAPDTVIDSAPPAGTTSPSASFSFHATLNGSTTAATFTCQIDGGAATACTSPTSYGSLTQGSHTFSVASTVNGVTDPTPATASWIVDWTAPSAPTNLAASFLSPTSVQLTWTAATDNTGVTGYLVFRDGTQIASIGAVTAWTDTSVTSGADPSYSLEAFDIAGNASPMSGSAAPPLANQPFASALRRVPYLTDLSGLHATIDFATDRSDSVASVQFGPVTNGSCSLTTTVPASHITISLGTDSSGNTIYEYQWKASLTLPSAGSYCYRAYLGTVDLLATNSSPVFQAQVPAGSLETFSFDVLGDWGEVDSTGANPAQAGVMSQIAKSGARFALTVGDNGYPAGSQANYGDIVTPGSAVFPTQFWGGVGGSLALFPAIGNHGFANNSAVHPQFANWPQDVSVATSSGASQMTAYPSINGSAPATYPDVWYAFSVGNVRFYVLTAAWADGNVGTGSVYANDYAAHWSSTSPEYLWLKNDLAAHQSGLKFAFFHYPLYSDQPSENSDTYLQGNSSLEGLLASNGVNIAFNGHAHIYERNAPAGGRNRQSLISYVTGGGGGQAQSTGTCSSNDLYAVGWSYTNSAGTACGAAPVPTSDAQVYHFLKVTVSGSTVTVTPTDSTGRTFDVQTFTFNPKPDTWIDSAPPVGTTSTSATFAFHGSSTSATYTCKLDGGAWGSCTSPVTYSSLAQGSHTFSVYATVGGVADPQPATWTWTVDYTAPTDPSGLTASATSPFSVSLGWTASTDNTGVTGYDLYRNGTLLTTLAPSASYVDTAVVGSTAYQYALRARDIAGNTSNTVSFPAVTTPPPPVPVFADGFESGDLSAWGSTSGLVVEGATVHGGSYAVEGDTTAAGPYAKKTLPSTYPDAYARVWFYLKSQTSQVNLLRFRDATGASIGYAYIETTGQLGVHLDAAGTNTLSATMPSLGAWHSLEFHVLTGSSGAVDVWLDDTRIGDISGTGLNTGAAAVGQFQIGEAQTTSQVYDVVLDDAAFGTSRLGPVADSPPSVPGNVQAAASSPYGSVALSWTASTDDVGVARYDIYRNGTLLASVGSGVTSYTDWSVLASTQYTYTVEAWDTSNNPSGQSAPAIATTPAAANPVFANGFESGGFSAWTFNGGLGIVTSPVRTGTYAAEGVNNTYARVTLPSTYADTYSRVAFYVKSWATQAALIRIKDSTGASIGNVFLSATGRIGFRNDAGATPTSYTSTTAPTTGAWHVIEAHVGVGGSSSTLGVWLDGALVGGLPSTVDLGTATAVAQLQIGDSATNSNDVVYDDAAFGTARLGITPDAPPSVPGSVAATATNPYGSVSVSWTASTDDIGVTGYSVYRNGSLLVNVASGVLSYTDWSALPSTAYGYAVQAWDTSGNPSGLSATSTATTPAAPTPLFADGFESGSLSAWTSSSGLVVENATAHTGTYAAEGNTTVTSAAEYARATLPATAADVYARAWVYIKSQTSSVTLVGFRSSASLIGSVYLGTNGKLGVIGLSGTTSFGSATAAPSQNAWHVIEFHLAVNGASSTTQVWLDGALVGDLSQTISSGTATTADTLQVGDNQATGRNYDVVYDDAAYGTSRLGP